VILVDDGLGDGLVQLAALAAVRRMHVAHCIVATPFATPGATQRLARHTDLVLTLASVEVGQRAGHTYWHSSLDDEAAAALVEHDRQRNKNVC
jgi:predicted phosphoribosyltransferase